MKQSKHCQSYTTSHGRGSYKRQIRINGKRHQKRFHRLADANRWYFEMKREKELIESGLKTESTPMTLDEFSQEWLQQRKAEGKPLSSLATDQGRLRLYVLETMGRRELQKISRREWEVFLKNLLLYKQLSPATRNRIHSLVSKIYNDARRQEVVFTNPLALIPKLRESHNKWNYWHSLDECQQYLEAASTDSPAFALFAMLALNTGARIGELLALQWEDIQLEMRRLHIWKIYDQFTHSICDRTKGKTDRWIGINDTLYEALVRHKSESQWTKPSDFLVCQGDGSPFNPWKIRRRHYRVCKRAGIKKIRVHDLRHTYASHYVMHGGNLADLQAILGHSTFEMTGKYAHLSPDHLQSKANVIAMGRNQQAGKVLSLVEARR